MEEGIVEFLEEMIEDAVEDCADETIDALVEFFAAEDNVVEDNVVEESLLEDVKEDTMVEDSVGEDDVMGEVVFEDGTVDENWLDDIAEEEKFVEASVPDDNVAEDTVEVDTFKNVMSEDKTKLGVTLLDEATPEDKITDRDAEKAALLEVVVEFRIDNEAAEMENAVDDAPLEDGGLEDSVVDNSLAEDNSNVADPLEITEETEPVAFEETYSIVDAAGGEADTRSLLFEAAETEGAVVVDVIVTFEELPSDNDTTELDGRAEETMAT